MCFTCVHVIVIVPTCVTNDDCQTNEICDSQTYFCTEKILSLIFNDIGNYYDIFMLQKFHIMNYAASFDLNFNFYKSIAVI